MPLRKIEYPWRKLPGWKRFERQVLSKDQVFGKGVSQKRFQVVLAPCSQVQSSLPSEQKRNTPRNFNRNLLFRNASSKRSKQSEKQRDERSLQRVPGPCSQVRPSFLAQQKWDTPRNFDTKRLIWNTFSECPKRLD